MSMKLSEIAEEVGVPICMLTADEIKSAGKIGAISGARAEVLLAELQTSDGLWQEPKFGSINVYRL